MNNLIMYFNELEDPRDARGLKHELTNIIVMSIYGILCGYNDCENIAYFLDLNREYFIKLLNLNENYGVPSADTLLRVFSLISPQKFMEIFSKWVKEIIKSTSTNNVKYSTIPIDGQAVKGATDKKNNGSIPYIVSAYLNDLGISIGQVKVDDKTNEITAIPELLDLIDIENSIITIDAIGTQTKIVEKIIDKKGHYCLNVKENQKSLYTNIKEYFDYAIHDQKELENIFQFSSTEKSRNRIERRESYITSNIDFIYDKDKWKSLKMIGMTRNYREINGELSIQDKYYILDLELSAEEFGKVTRKHWSIENKLHWILDVHFREDFNHSKLKNSIHNFSLLRKICYNLIKLDTSIGNRPINKKIMYYNHNLDNLKRLIFGIIPNN